MPTVLESPQWADSGPKAFPAFFPLILPSSLFDRRHCPILQTWQERAVKRMV